MRGVIQEDIGPELIGPAACDQNKFCTSCIGRHKGSGGTGS
ncbi:MAG: hypothetical protein CM1200mP2_11140 [Planctomycetaceae bacterium]|nr:MAG: hypothetical protein CM1200mP2_11140 [Planctomycetaceae bacterium]